MLKCKRIICNCVALGAQCSCVPASNAECSNCGDKLSDTPDDKGMYLEEHELRAIVVALGLAHRDRPGGAFGVNFKDLQRKINPDRK